MSEFDLAFEKIAALCKDFQSKESYFKSAAYSEAQARIDFIDKFWIALGWDVNHEIQTNPYEQEVKVEKGVKMRGTHRRADYAFYHAPNFHDVRFFVEAKKPSVDIGNAESYFQLIRYGWNSETPLAVLTDFEQLHILDCRYRPDIESALSRSIAQYHFTDYTNSDKFAEIYWLFSREAVADGSIEKRAKELPKPRGKAIQRGLFPGGYQSIDDSFLAELDDYRTSLARTFKNKNPDFDSETLTEITQRTLDRLVFLRFLEDKGIEPIRRVENFGDKGTAWEDFIAESRRLDGIYNGIVYKHHDILDAKKLIVDDKVFAQICKDIAHANSPYDFNAIPIHILGSIYERFLGKVIVASAKRAKVEEKPEVRKAGGVYYTPQYIVRYIVENTVGKLIEGKKPAQIAKMRFADISCGSGSFLLGVFDVLLKYHGQYYNKYPGRAKKGECVKRDDILYLSLSKKREILLNNIYGVDIDSQAVEVCQLSLYLKLLEDETEFSAQQYIMDILHTAEMKQLLPDLSKNIICGNSLIGRDILEGQLFATDEERKLNPMDFESEFPEVMKRGGFDAIVGNPPYRMLQPHNTTKEILAYYRIRYTAAEFKIELFHMFLQRATSLLKDRGYLSYIIPTTILNNVYASTLRGWLMDRCCVEQIAVASGRVFADADVHTSVLVFRCELSQTMREDHVVKTTMQLTPEFASRPVFRSHTYQATFVRLLGRVWNVLVDENNASLISRLTTDFEPLEKMAMINRGLITGKRDKYFAEKKVSKQHVPILAGRDVHRYHVADPSEFVLFKRPKSAGGSWNKEVHFAPHKLVVRQICEEPTASMLHMPLAVTGNIFTIRAESLETEVFLLGIINSRLIAFFWRTMFADFKASFPQVTIFSLAQLPIYRVNLSNATDKKHHDKIVTKVERMLEAKKQLAKAKTDKDKSYYEKKCSALDRQIDALVYELYDLTDEEIKIVEETVVS